MVAWQHWHGGWRGRWGHSLRSPQWSWEPEPCPALLKAEEHYPRGWTDGRMDAWTQPLLREVETLPSSLPSISPERTRDNGNKEDGWGWGGGRLAFT